jgi:hypothetical protein
MAVPGRAGGDGGRRPDLPLAASHSLKESNYSISPGEPDAASGTPAFLL